MNELPTPESDDPREQDHGELFRTSSRQLPTVPMQPGDFLLLCSDGLTRAVEESAMSRAICQLRHPQQICDFLVAAANGNGGADNITVVAVEVRSSLPRRVFHQLRQLTTGGHCA